MIVSFEYFSFFAIFSALYSIPPVIITFKMFVFYFKKRRTLNPNTIHPALYQQFLIMQILNICHVITSFFTMRIPDAALLDMTFICYMNNFLRFLMLFNHAVVYAKNLSTISFCLIRVFLLFTETGKDASFIICITLFNFPISFLLALPTYFMNVTCIGPSDSKFPTGSFMIISDSENGNMNTSKIIEVLIYPFFIIMILLLNICMFWKLGQSRKLSTVVRRKYDRNAERSLTITMTLILLPVIINSSIAISNILNHFNCVLYLIRPWFIDARAHIIVCYFYFTHPIFRRRLVSAGRVKTLKTRETR
ncbi:hypothetical protein CRE_14191 [Caenorhabditis remanei]|uniref:G-protein coupled receptors family 1 profile domain-containing protein n=1 Tax=Caenorhabditis remanei TaxID=31234 RepID=E3N1K6_CAERE|nr:hypothetical protein CRE_14191 [Caenorhabditis remanei]